MGLSYGAIENFTYALDCVIGKTMAYENVQAAGVISRKQQKQPVQRGGQRPWLARMRRM
jgi:hypothetical protein